MGVGQGAKLLGAVLIGLGLLARLWPLFIGGDRIFTEFPTEDGYLMLTIARNLALGHGPSIAAGEILTNGTQPLVTLIWAAGFWAVGGERSSGLVLVHLLSIVVALASAGLLYRLVPRLLPNHPRRQGVGAVTAGLWFANTISTRHSMNALETGLYALLVLVVAWLFLTRDQDGPLGAGRQLLYGVVLGLCFWARNDAIFLVLSACLLHLYGGRRGGRAGVLARFRETLVFGSLSVLVASPWLIYNLLTTGHVVPVSGRAESLSAHFGSNLAELFPVTLEYLLAGLLPIPERLQHLPAVTVASAVLVTAVFSWLLPRAWRRASEQERELLFLVGLYGGLLAAFYALYFGAGWFMSRYLFPVAAFLALGLVLLIDWFLAGRFRLRIAASVLAVGLVGALQLRVLERGGTHEHYHVVEWVQAHVPEAAWVGAIQTGTLGFFHDRTINLDGKVNPAAYDAQVDKRIDEYVVASDIEYLADWAGLRTWLQMPFLDDHFRLWVYAPEQNLVVLKRDDGRYPARNPPQGLATLEAAQRAALEEQRSSDPRAWAEAQIELALLLRGRGDRAAARSALEPVLELVLPPEGNEDPVVEAAEALAELARIDQGPSRAFELLSRATERQRHLAAARPTNRQAAHRLAQLRLHQGELAQLLGDQGQAEAAYQEALSLEQGLVDADPQDRWARRGLSMAYRLLGELAMERHALAEAGQYFAKTEAIRLSLVAAEPDNPVFAADLAVAYSGLAELAACTEAPEAARDRYQQARAIRRRLREAGDQRQRRLDLQRSQGP